MSDHGQHHHHSHGAGEDEGALAELLELDAAVLADVLSSATAWLAELAEDRQVGRIADLGCGTGTGSVALAERFPAAEVLAVDGSAPFLELLRTKASGLGLGGRIRTVEANLDETWPELGTVDLVWASMSLHHLADPIQALGHVAAALAPGAQVAVAELGTAIRVLPYDVGIGRPGLQDRCVDAMQESHDHDLPHLGADWGSLLTRAGYKVAGERTFAPDPATAASPVLARYAQGWLRRTRERLGDVLDGDDLATLDVLTSEDDPRSVLHRDDLVLEGSRTVWVGERA